MDHLLWIPLFWVSIKLIYVLWYLELPMSSSCPLDGGQQYVCNMTFNIDPIIVYLVLIL